MSERNHEVIKSQQLLDEYGNIAEPGWSRKQLQQYSRTQIKAPKFRIKEWDYYLVVGDDCAVAFTLLHIPQFQTTNNIQCGHFFVYLIPSGFSKKWWLIEAGK